MTTAQLVFAVLTLTFTLIWAVFLVMISAGVIVESPPDFSEAGVGMVMMFLVNQSKKAVDKIYGGK